MAEEYDDITYKQYNEILGMEEETKMQELSRNALQARQSITNELGIRAGATVDSVRYILEEILSYRLDTMRQNLMEQNKNNKLYKNQLQKNQEMENTKLNTITLQNLKTLALLKKMHQVQMESHSLDYANDNEDKDNLNLLKKLKIENIELKAQLKQSQQHIEYLEESKVNTIKTMSQEIQRLRQQIIDLNTGKSSSVTPTTP